MTKKIVVQDQCPKQSAFRKIVGEVFNSYSTQKTTYFKAISDFRSSESEIIKMFGSGLNVNTEGELKGQSALYEACDRGRSQVVTYLLNHGAEINPDPKASNETSRKTPLNAALGIQNEKIVLALLEKGADVNAKDEDGKTPLHIAIRNLDTSRTDRKTFIYPDEEKELPKNPKKIIQEILKRGPDLNVPDESGLTPLYYACEKGDLELVKLLIDNGANVNVYGKYGRPPLYTALNKGNIDIVRLLLSNHARTIPAKDEEWSFSPLSLALGAEQYGKFTPNIDLVKLLIVCGADVNMKAGPLKTPPLHSAVKHDSLAAVQSLLDKGADSNAVNVENETALYIALNQAEPDKSIIKLLLSKRANPNIAKNSAYIPGTIRFDSPIYPLHSAALKGDVEIARMLYDQKASINAEDGYKNTALHLAAKAGHKPMVQFLLESGATTSLKNATGQTAADVAKESGHPEIAKLL